MNNLRLIDAIPILLASLVSANLVACQAEPEADPVEGNTTASNNTTPDANQTTPDEELVACDAEAGVVRFTTSDGVELVADFSPAKNQGRGAVLLFHMIPPSNDRSS